jgi:hypothetical protein
MRSFYQDRLGRKIGKALKKRLFSGDRKDRTALQGPQAPVWNRRDYQHVYWLPPCTVVYRALYCVRGKKTFRISFAMPSYANNAIILPRQARDNKNININIGGSTQKEMMRFLADLRFRCAGNEHVRYGAAQRMFERVQVCGQHRTSI